MKKKLILCAFIVIEALFYTFITLDSYLTLFSYDTTNWIRYISIIIYAIFAFILFIKDKDRIENIPLYVSSYACVAADSFLLFRDEDAYIGIIFFALVSMLYQYYATHSIKNIVIQLGVGVVSAFIVFLVTRNSDLCNIQNVLAVSYIMMCLFSIVMIIFNYVKYNAFKDNIYFFLGVILLFLCDISVGLSNIGAYNIFGPLMWIFYLPSQMCMFITMFKNYERSL